MLNPAETIHAAPILPIEALCLKSVRPLLIRSARFKAMIFTVTPDGIPVRGGAGVMSIPLGLFMGFDIWCGGAKAMPGAKWFL